MYYYTRNDIKTTTNSLDYLHQTMGSLYDIWHRLEKHLMRL
jgi:hypothetical protein